MTRRPFDEDDYRARFAVAITSTREMIGITRTELAARLGWTSARIREYELGRRSVRVEDAAQIAAAFGLHLGDLLPSVPTALERVANRAGD